MVQAVAVVQSGTLGQAYESAPVGGYREFSGAGGRVRVMTLIFPLVSQ